MLRNQNICQRQRLDLLLIALNFQSSSPQDPSLHHLVNLPLGYYAAAKLTAPYWFPQRCRFVDLKDLHEGHVKAVKNEQFKVSSALAIFAFHQCDPGSNPMNYAPLDQSIWRRSWSRNRSREWLLLVDTAGSTPNHKRPSLIFRANTV